MTNVIALTGHKGAGKDTIAALVYDILGPSVRTIAFADPIKLQIMKFFDLPSTHQYDLFKRTNVTYQLKDHMSHSVSGRHIVREIGMLMRSYNTFQFTEYVKDEINKDLNSLWIITDLRFDNEYLLVKSFGGKIVKVFMPNEDHKDMHITERGFDDALCDYVINNDGTIEELKEKVMGVLKQEGLYK
jgi:hypothetical protein